MAFLAAPFAPAATGALCVGDVGEVGGVVGGSDGVGEAAAAEEPTEGGGEAAAPLRSRRCRGLMVWGDRLAGDEEEIVGLAAGADSAPADSPVEAGSGTLATSSGSASPSASSQATVVPGGIRSPAW